MDSASRQRRSSAIDGYGLECSANIAEFSRNFLRASFASDIAVNRRRFHFASATFWHKPIRRTQFSALITIMIFIDSLGNSSFERNETLLRPISFIGVHKSSLVSEYSQVYPPDTNLINRQEVF